ncbi:carbohydrate ABC transporter permease [Amphibacillus sp. Q70]|uniref:carbohydrate ABC transporter permease n=1 Tax=Amphibacillus sp. Q70 TaxID=3453416 RepID=UPI003F83AD60
MSRRKKDIWTAIILVIFCIAFLFPIYWTITTALKTPGQIMKLPPEFIPSKITFDNFIRVFTEHSTGVFFKNSLVISITTTIVTAFIATFAGYGFSRFTFRGKETSLLLIIAVRMVPGLVYMVPYFIIFNNIGMLDSKIGLTIVYITANLPLAIWLAISFFDEIPKEVFESAKIDGCNEMQTYFKVALPLVIPGIVVVSILVFLASYNEFGTALVLIFNDANKTLPLGISGMVELQKDTPFGLLAAAGTVAMIPAFILALTTQKYIQKGITAGAVKG